MTEYGQGFVTSAGQQTKRTSCAMELGNNGAPGTVLAGQQPPAPRRRMPSPGSPGLFSNLVAWQQTPGATGTPEIRVRYEPRARRSAPSMVLSSPA